MLEIELFDHLTMCIYQIIYLIYMYKRDLALYNQQWLVFHKTKPSNQLRWWTIVIMYWYIQADVIIIPVVMLSALPQKSIEFDKNSRNFELNLFI